MRVLNKRIDPIPADAVYVGRPSKWGNPFAIGRDGDRAEVVVKYEAWLNGMIESGQLDPSELAGKDLVCWCAPELCHAEVLIDYANK